MKRSMKKRMMVLILALMVMGCVAVFADETVYTFYLDLYNTVAYSEEGYKGYEHRVATVQQTGASAGTYPIAYTVVQSSTLDNVLAATTQIWSNDYSRHQLPYTHERFITQAVPARLRGQYVSGNISNVTGRWSAGTN